MNMWKRLGIATLLVVMGTGIFMISTVANAQDTPTPTEVVRKLSKTIPGPAVLKAELMNKFDRETGAFKGDFNITVFPTAKAANGFKYNGVKHFMFIAANTIAFYSGEEGKGNKPVIVMTSTFTIETR